MTGHAGVSRSCDDSSPNALRLDQAWEHVLATLTPMTASERVPLRDALGRVLANDVLATVDVPSSVNSAMDGYAIRGADLQPDGSARLRIVGKALAGHRHTDPVGPGDCIRVTTGASMPVNTDTVVMQEQVQVDGEQAIVKPGQQTGQNVRQAGEDLARGERILAAGTAIGVAELGVLGSTGLIEVGVRRRLRAAFFSTGDELCSAGQPLAPGEIYDSNRYSLYAALRSLGAETIDLGVVRDEPEALEAALRMAAASADVIVTSGGVSVGEADHVKTLMDRLGTVQFWKLAMRPGRPLAFGRIDDCALFGLPGNPVSVLATWYQFVRPALRYLMGETVTPPVCFDVPTSEALRKRPGRTEFQRGILETDANGRLTVRSTGEQGSGILSSLTRADCFIVLEHDRGRVEPGELVKVQPLRGILDWR